MYKQNVDDYLICNFCGELETIKIQMCNPEREKDIFTHFNKVYDEMPDKSQLVIESKEYIDSYFSGGGFVVIATNEKDLLVGCLTVRFPNLQKDNLGRDINLNKEDLQKVAHIETVTVEMKYRGNNLQLKMLEYAEKIINSNYKYIMATVAPDNYASIKTFKTDGFKLVKTKQKYGGLLRGIYLKNRIKSSH